MTVREVNRKISAIEEAIRIVEDRSLPNIHTFDGNIYSIAELLQGYAELLSSLKVDI